MNKVSYVRRNYLLPKHVYEDLRKISEATGIAVSRVIDAAFQWWLDKVEKEQEYLPRFLARLKTYKQEFATSEKKLTPAYMATTRITLLDIISRSFAVEKTVFIYAVIREYYSLFKP